VIGDVARVLALPRTAAPPWRQAGALRTGRPLRPEQAQALGAIAQAPAPRGSVVGLQVGGGKTLVGMLAPAALSPRPARPLALVPAGLVGQWQSMHDDWSRDYHLPTMPAVSHHELSRPTSARLLETYRPDCLVIDEAHAFRHLTSARTKRLVRYVVANPGTRVVVMTGSLGADSLQDHAHLLELALRDGAPVPLNRHTLAQWCACIDHRGTPDVTDWATVWPLVRAFSRRDPGPLTFTPPSARIPHSTRVSLARAAFNARLRCTPGVTLSKGTVCTAALRMRLVRPRPPRAISDALTALSDRWALPDGTELVDALEMDRHRRTLSRGFYQCWDWGAAGPDEEWLDARRSWSRLVRNVLEYRSRAGMDSAALVADAAAQGRLGDRMRDAVNRWQTAHAALPKGPPTVTTWLPGCRAWLVDLVERWLTDHPRALVWYTTRSVGRALADVLPVHGAGSDAPTASHAAASIRVHGTGTDGLHHRYPAALVVEPPASAQVWEQLLGRQHRPGARHPVVSVDVLTPTWVGRRAVEEAIARTGFLTTAGGVGPFAKLNVADWLPPTEDI